MPPAQRPREPLRARVAEGALRESERRRRANDDINLHVPTRTGSSTRYAQRKDADASKAASGSRLPSAPTAALQPGVSNGAEGWNDSGETTAGPQSQRGCTNCRDAHTTPFPLRLRITTMGIALGVTSQSLVCQQLVKSPSQQHLHIPPALWTTVWFVGATTVVLLILLYSYKMLAYWTACKREICHPLRASFFVAPLISIMFLTLTCPPPIDEVKDQQDHDTTSEENEAQGPIAFSSVSLWLAVPEAAVTLLFSIGYYRSWFFGDVQSISNNNPTYQIAVVGNLIVSSVLSRANAPDFALFFLTVGTFVWIIVFTAVFTSGMSEIRGTHHWHLPNELHPTLFLFVAPPSSASNAWAAFLGSFGIPAKMFLSFGLFMYMFLLVGLPALIRRPLTLSSWAYSFPMASAGVALNTYADSLRSFNASTGLFEENTGSQVAAGFAAALLLTSSAAVVTLCIWTAYTFVYGDLFPDDPLLGDINAQFLPTRLDHQRMDGHDALFPPEHNSTEDAKSPAWAEHHATGDVGTSGGQHDPA